MIQQHTCTWCINNHQGMLKKLTNTTHGTSYKCIRILLPQIEHNRLKYQSEIVRAVAIAHFKFKPQIRLKMIIVAKFYSPWTRNMIDTAYFISQMSFNLQVSLLIILKCILYLNFHNPWALATAGIPLSEVIDQIWYWHQLKSSICTCESMKLFNKLKIGYLTLWK